MKYLWLLVLVGCGFSVNGNIVVTHKIDVTNLEVYFEDYCRTLYPDATEEEINTCIDTEVSNFIKNVGKV